MSRWYVNLQSMANRAGGVGVPKATGWDGGSLAPLSLWGRLWRPQVGIAVCCSPFYAGCCGGNAIMPGGCGLASHGDVGGGWQAQEGYGSVSQTFFLLRESGVNAVKGPSSPGSMLWKLSRSCQRANFRFQLYKSECNGMGLCKRGGLWQQGLGVEAG